MLRPCAALLHLLDHGWLVILSLLSSLWLVVLPAATKRRCKATSAATVHEATAVHSTDAAQQQLQRAVNVTELQRVSCRCPTPMGAVIRHPAQDWLPSRQ